MELRTALRHELLTGRSCEQFATVEQSKLTDGPVALGSKHASTRFGCADGIKSDSGDHREHRDRWRFDVSAQSSDSGGRYASKGRRTFSSREKLVEGSLRSFYRVARWLIDKIKLDASNHSRLRAEMALAT